MAIVRITQLNSASVIIEDRYPRHVKVLCDPWLVGEEFIGSWAMYPPYRFEPEKFADIDFIYISHIHADHCSLQTLARLDKSIPVLIHNFPEKFLKRRIEGAGFKVIELEHNMRIRLKGDVHINIMAADNCDPTICGKLMGCGLAEARFGTTQIDTMAVFDNGKQVIMNTNDCPWEIVKRTAAMAKEIYNRIDVLLMGYITASSWPQCYAMPEEDKIEASKTKQKNMFGTVKDLIDLVRPRYYIPFAGRYTLCGKNVDLNPYRGEPDLEYSCEEIRGMVPDEKSKAVLINNDGWFDVDTETTDSEFVPISKEEKTKYTRNVLSKKKFPYEGVQALPTDEVCRNIPTAYENFESVRRRIGWYTDTPLIIKATDDKGVVLVLVVTCNGGGFRIIQETEIARYDSYMSMSLDIRLLSWILQGPQIATWSDADAGAHIRYERVGATYKRGLFFCLNRLHA